MADYPKGLRLRPIEAWPGSLTRDRKVSPFTANWSITLDQLDRELWHLGPRNRGNADNAPAVLQIAMREQDFRLDGLPRANSRPEHPGVILNVDATRQGALSFPCDRFTDWRDNLRAIVLGMEALRKLDRYGITPGDRQYTGWKQLGAGTAAVEAGMSRAEAAKVLYLGSGVPEPIILRDPEAAAKAHRAARAAAHPDRHGDDRTNWDRVEEAATVLGLTP
ncbi:molecular chaperone DnaJ [Tsukamurella asaccharolytica]|uniref:Molecular chaperone DnaJ n=1 Tax=Tsukamurella asaccharolytica TaxID=2592067 RepID=A0A5C5RE00_9ACTN|nr:molecular chaperone DnaJ [Tsukamurella asaccharolytica]TWS20804.1 molecular chaperone DnaJ [Tsukamurella asaccharolytica]